MQEHAYDKFVHAIQASRDLLLDPKNLPLRGLVKAMLTRLLEVEGPPPTPVMDESYRKALILGNGALRRAIVIAETWVKGPWRCLLLYSPSIALERPIHTAKLTDRTRENGDPVIHVRTFTPSRSQKHKDKIAAACRYFGLEQMTGYSAVVSHFNASRTFLAWREVPDENWSSALRGDVDNYQKLQLDALVEAGVLPDDRWVMCGHATKADYWGEKAPTMDTMLREIATKKLKEIDDPDEVAAKVGITKKLARELARSLRAATKKVAAKETHRQEKATAAKAKVDTKRDAVRSALLRGLSGPAVKKETGAPMELIKQMRKDMKTEGVLTTINRGGRPKGAKSSTPKATDSKSAAVQALLMHKRPPTDEEIQAQTGASPRTIRRVRASLRKPTKAPKAR